MSTTNRSSLPATRVHLGCSARPERSGLLNLFGAILDRLLEWQERAAQRRHLAGLDDRMLRDIGLSRAEVVREYRKFPWQR